MTRPRGYAEATIAFSANMRISVSGNILSGWKEKLKAAFCTVYVTMKKTNEMLYKSVLKEKELML